MAKIGLVVEGGGMKCAYGAGILDRFLDDDIEFDYKLYPGPSTSQNAIRLLEYLGFPKKIITEAKEKAEI